MKDKNIFICIPNKSLEYYPTEISFNYTPISEFSGEVREKISFLFSAILFQEDFKGNMMHSLKELIKSMNVKLSYPDLPRVTNHLYNHRGLKDFIRTVLCDKELLMKFLFSTDSSVFVDVKSDVLKKKGYLKMDTHSWTSFPDYTVFHLTSVACTPISSN